MKLKSDAVLTCEPRTLYSRVILYPGIGISPQEIKALTQAKGIFSPDLLSYPAMIGNATELIIILFKLTPKHRNFLCVHTQQTTLKVPFNIL